MQDPLQDRLPERIARRLQRPLPGRGAHREMVSELAYGRHAGPPQCTARPAAVLICLQPYEGRWHIPLTLRPAHMLDHAGQVSLPGGMREPGESPEACALREYEEELGAPSAALRVLGRLTPLYVFASDFLVTPCVAVAEESPRFTPNPEEVERVLYPALDELLDPDLRGSHVVVRRGLALATRHIRLQHDRVWGATARMLAELGHVVQDALREGD